MGCSASQPAPPDLAIRRRSGSRLEEQKKALKFVMLGDIAVGKSCIIMRYLHGRFSQKYTATIGAAFFMKEVELPGQKDAVALHLWDTGGEERYRAMTRLYYNGAAAGMLVYDVTSPPSFHHLQEWVDDFREYCPDAEIAILGNKCDLEDRRTVKQEEVADFARRNNLTLLFDTSAKAGMGVEDAFFETAAKAVKKM
eukprot:PLAT7105.1.p2 GENE.PLAT7105.1~~PLAT7105.1.p2  ORF type:complete len:197 (-),score=85.91 PLAT7105.1:134-724(-)